MELFLCNVFQKYFWHGFQTIKKFFNIVASEMDTSIATWQMAWKFNYKCIKKHLFVENWKEHIDRKKKCCQKKWKLIDQTIELCVRIYTHMCVEFLFFCWKFSVSIQFTKLLHIGLMACHNIMNKMENNCIITNAMDGTESGAGAGVRTDSGKNTNETGQTVERNKIETFVCQKHWSYFTAAITFLCSYKLF